MSSPWLSVGRALFNLAHLRPVSFRTAPQIILGQINCQASTKLISSLTVPRIKEDNERSNEFVEFDGVPEVPNGKIRLSNIWLRDNCRCNTCVNKGTGQRAYETFAPGKTAEEPAETKASESGLRVRWTRDQHESFYPWKFLNTYLTGDRPEIEPPNLVSHFGAEGSIDVESWPPSVAKQDIDLDEHSAIGRLTNLIRRFGFAFVTSVPYESGEATESVLEKIAFIRPTHYGGFYDFTANLAYADMAYTNLALEAHTDNTYFSDPAGLQALHLLSHHASKGSGVESNDSSLGGKSLLVDGFHVAKVLEQEDKDAYAQLASMKLQWHASGNEGINISPYKLFPVLEEEKGPDGLRKLLRVRWNNQDRGVVPNGNHETIAGWYEAARKWNEILTRPGMEYWFQLKPGNLLLMDNWRVLHGRSAFTGRRRICGGYINRDDFISRWRNTNFSREQIVEQTVG